MTPAQLLNLLSAEGIKVWAEGDDLRYSGPKGALTDSLKAALRTNKPLLMAALTRELTPIPVAPEVGPAPLSFAQERLWFLDQMTPASAAYNVPLAWRLQGDLDTEALRRTFEQLVQRHEALRTGFEVRDGGPRQVIHAAPTWALVVQDLSSVPELEREAEVRRRVEVEAYAPFSLQAKTLLRTSLLRLGASDHVLLITLHHIVSDAWSIEIFTREMAALYAAFREAKPSPLGAPPLKYADYAAWQRSQLQGERLEREVAYWRENLAGAAVLALPTDRRRPRVQTHHGAVHTFELSPDTTRRLRSLGSSHGATLFMTLTAAFQVLLHRYTGQEDLSVGTPIANRTRRELDDVIGCFVNTVVLRSQFDGNATFLQVLAKVKAATLGAFAHQELPFARVVDGLGVTRDASKNPLFQVMLTLDHVSSDAARLAGLSVAPIETAQRNARCDLSAAFAEGGPGLLGWLEYDVELFEAATIQRLATHLSRLIDGVLDHPELPVSELSLLSPSEEHQLLKEWNATEVALSGSAFAHQLFEAVAARCPDAVAVAQGSDGCTYERLNCEANQLACHLRQLGVGPETRVAICLQRAPSLAVAVLAVLKAGGAYVPLDASYPLERLAFMLRDCTPLVALTDTQGAAVVRAALSGASNVSPPLTTLDLQRAKWALRRKARRMPVARA